MNYTEKTSEKKNVLKRGVISHQGGLNREVVLAQGFFSMELLIKNSEIKKLSYEMGGFSSRGSL